MNVTLTAVVLLTTAALCYAADAECKYRKSRKLALHWPDPTDCTRYYRCTNRSIKREVVCAEGKVYNSKTGKCSNNIEGLCKLTLAMPLDANINVCANETSGVYLDQPGYCRNFYICNQNEAYPQVCDAGSRFNSTTRTCIPDTDSECWQNKCIGENNGTYLPNESSCSSFYVCAAGETIEQECGSGSYFNSSKRICLPDPDGQFCWENLCVGKKDGEFVQNVKDCYSYYICVSAKPIQQYCPEGSYFNSTENSCLPGECSPVTTECPTTETTESTTECISESTESTPSTECTDATTPTTETTESTTECTSESTESKSSTECTEVTTPATESTESTTECISESTESTSSTECTEVTTSTTETTESTTECTSESTESTPSTECTEVTTHATEATCDCPGGYKEGELIPFPNYPENCDKYYECSNGKLEEKECGEGNGFNSTLGVCEPDVDHICWPVVTTECSEVTTPATEATCDCPGGYKEGELIPFPNYPENCDKYYECSNGKLVEKECGEGNRFNSTLGVCQPDIENVCSRINCDARSYNVIGRRNRRSVDRSPIDTFDAPLCLGLYAEGEIIGDSSNCRRYQICVNGEMISEDCGFGNYFNSNTLTCNIDIQQVCIGNNENVNEYLSTKKSEEITDTISNIGVEDCSCPGGYKEGELLPFPNYPENCDKYYICTDGRLQERECGEGNYFDSQLGVCVPDVDNTCWPNVCYGQIDGTYVPDSTNCTSFYLCQDGKGEIYNCPPEKWFNPVDKICMPDFNATCINPCKDTTGITFLPNPDCSKYFLCNDCKPYVETCPEGGFDITLNKCHADAVCEATLCVGKSDGTTYPFVGNDTKFYLCMGGVAQIRECKSGQIFNKDVGVCLEEPSSQCNQTECQSTNPEENAFAPLTNTDNTAFCLCRGDSAFLHHCADNYTFRADLGICYSNAPCDPELCDSFPENTRSQNRNNSHSFCLCVSKQQVIVDCPNNQTYNAVTQTCQVLDERCSSTFCLTAPEYSTFPALNNDTDGFCECISSGTTYKLCGNDKKYNAEKGICLPEIGDDCSSSLCSGNAGLIFGAASDPHSFCYCINDGLAIKQNCPNSEIFNETLLICQAVGCDGEICLTNPSGAFPALNEPYAFCVCGSSDPSSVTKHDCANGTRFDPYYLFCKEDPCDKSFCSNSSNNGIPYPANNYQYGYCVCKSGIPELVSCSDGNLFNPVSRQCESSSTVECDVAQCANTTSEYPFAIAAKNDTHGFCYCFSSTEVEFFLCPDNALFDPISEICNISCTKSAKLLELNQGISTVSCLGTYGEGEYVPHRTNNQLFYVCYNAKLLEGDCGAGNIFDQDSLTCQPLDKRVMHQNKSIMRMGEIPENNVRTLTILKNYLKKFPYF